MSIIEHISDLLRKLDFKYQLSNRTIEMIWKTDHFDELKIQIFPSEHETWLYITAIFNKITEYPEELQGKLASLLLKKSWEFNGVKLGIDKHNRICVIAETNDTDITDMELRILIGHVVQACNVLHDIIEKFEREKI